MRVMVMAVSQQSGAPKGKKPTPEMMAAFMKYNQELIDAGVLLGDGRLYPAAQARRVVFDGAERVITDGPFAEAKEVIGGYWLWKVASMEDALTWLKKAPYDGGTFEVRQIFEPQDM